MLKQKSTSLEGVSTLPFAYHRIKIVESFDELINTPFNHGVNALCWPRNLAGDFNEIVEKLGSHEGITTLDEDDLEALSLSESGKAARDILLQDQQLLRDAGQAPNLDWIPHSLRPETTAPVITDVYSFHADSATVETDTYLCSYNSASSEGIRNEETIPHIDIPETRAALLKCYGGEDDERFSTYLKDNFFDLHYAPMPQAKPFSFGLGNLWRIATQYPDSPVPPCIHRSPTTSPDQPARLLLIS